MRGLRQGKDMGKYIIMQDIRHMASYRNINARLLYMHICMGCDISTYEYRSSLRKLALDLDMTVDTVRYALKQLVSDGLVTPQTTPQTTPQSAPQSTPQTTPHLTIYRINGNGTPNGTPNTTPYTTPYTTENPTQKNNLNNKNNKIPSLASACVAWEDMREMVKNTLKVDAATAAAMVDTFKERQGMKGKAWKDEGDLKAHLIAFAEKRLASLPRQAKGGRMSDAQARQQEYARAQEAQEAKGEKEKAWESVQDAWRWWKDAERKAAASRDEQERGKASQHAAAMKATYERLKQEWEKKFKNLKL